jgi:hypothetical protein
MPDSTPSGAAGSFAVSDPDRRLLELMASGLDRAALIEALGWPEAELSQRLRDVRQASGASTDIQAVVLALRQGLID